MSAFIQFTHIFGDGGDDGGVGEAGDLREGVGDAERDGRELGPGHVGVAVHEPARDGELVQAQAEGNQGDRTVCALQDVTTFATAFSINCPKWQKIMRAFAHLSRKSHK